MLLPPLIISLIWILAAGALGRPAPLVPTTTIGRVALVSLVLMILVVVTDASLAVTAPVGVVMLALGAGARWARHDRGLLLALPVTFGLWVLVLPFFFE